MKFLVIIIFIETMIDSQYYFVSPAENHLIAVTYFVSIFVSILLL